MAKIDKNNNFVITNYLTVGAQRALRIGDDEQVSFPVPFAYGAFLGSPKALRIIVEAALAAVNWTTRSIVDDGELSVNGTDVVILSGSGTTITLPAITAGRILVIKDTSGNASSSIITVDVSDIATESIDGSNLSFGLNANYGAIVLVGNFDTKTWHTIALV